MLTARGIAMAVCALVGANALADGDTKGSPTDLDWLRAEVGDGALIHHSDGRIYLTELATAESVVVGNGNQPEFSPDGTKFAWIDGTAAKGRLRRGDSSIHVIAENVDGSRGARLGNKGLAQHMVYGDFTVGDGVGQGWLAP